MFLVIDISMHCIGDLSFSMFVFVQIQIEVVSITCLHPTVLSRGKRKSIKVPQPNNWSWDQAIDLPNKSAAQAAG